jgi:hypothetical protein
MAIDPVLEKNLSRQALCSIHILQAIRSLAHTIKRAGHLPLGRRIEERQLLFRRYVPQRADCEIRGIYKDIRFAGMIEVHDNSIILDVLLGSYLDSLVCGMVDDTKIANLEYQLTFFNYFLSRNSCTILSTVGIYFNYPNPSTKLT